MCSCYFLNICNCRFSTLIATCNRYSGYSKWLPVVNRRCKVCRAHGLNNWLLSFYFEYSKTEGLSRYDFSCLFFTLFFGENNLIPTAQVHKSEQPQKPIVISIKIAIFVWFVLSIPKLVNKLTAYFIFGSKCNRS